MGEMITDVGIDLDGVLYPFSNAFRNYCEVERGLVNLPDPTHWNFYEDWGLDEETFNAWLLDAAKNHRIFATHLPYSGVLEAWADLRDTGVKIHVLTARPQSAWAQTAEWLNDCKLHVDTLHFGPSKAFLANLATKKSILLDDHIYYYEEAEKSGIVPCLMSRPWNSTKEDANRVSSLAEFVSFLRGYNARGETPNPVTINRYKPYMSDKQISKIKEPYNPYKIHTEVIYPSKEYTDPWIEPRHEQNF